MKLVAKYNLINVFFGSILLTVGGWVFYLIFFNTLNREIDEKLTDNKERIVALIKEGKPVGSVSPVIEIEQVNFTPSKSLFVHDTILLDPISKDRELFREVTSFEKINDQIYRITTRQIIPETHDYVENIGLGLIVMWLIINIGLMLLTLVASQKLWQPFQHNLKKLRKFKVTDESPIEFRKTTTREFNELSGVLIELTEKVRRDYHSLKEFSENAAHEIQTPLMIIQAKLEDALQYPDLDPEIGEKIQVSLASSNRLSKLVQTLLFITKIENHQFDKKENVNLAECIKTELVLLDDFIGARKILITTHLESVTKEMDPLLADMLITNLLTNAIKHNVDNGSITITLDQSRLTISNPSNNVIKDTESMFDRFSKASQASSSHGLGLAIVKKICQENGWKISYVMKDIHHTIEILF